MSNKRTLTAAVAALGVVFGFPGTAEGQQGPGEKPSTQEVLMPSEVLTGANIRLKVNGMVCPFCAYGLEVRLKEISSIDEVLIRVSDGLVQIRTKEGQELTDETIEDAVKRSGFSLTEIERVKG